MNKHKKLERTYSSGSLPVKMEEVSDSLKIQASENWNGFFPTNKTIEETDH